MCHRRMFYGSFFYFYVNSRLAVIILVAIPTKVIAIMESKNVSNEINSPPSRITIESKKKIIIPTLIAKILAIICANISAPLTLVLFFNINPIPNPTKVPPIIELTIEERAI